MQDALPLTKKFPKFCSVVLCGLAAVFTAVAESSMAAEKSCPAASLFAHGTATIPVIKVYTGTDGISHITRTEIKGFTVPFFNTGKVLTQTVLGPSPKVVLVQGPPSESIPLRTGIGRVMFLTLQGSSTVILPSGEEATALPGEAVLFDDTSSKTGHAGKTGACGYIALSIPIADGSPDFAEQH